MAKRTANKSRITQAQRAARPVRPDHSETDHESLILCAKERGLNKASYARQAVLEKIKSDEVSK